MVKPRRAPCPPPDMRRRYRLIAALAGTVPAVEAALADGPTG